MVEGVFSDTETHMQQSLDAISRELSGLRTGRANISILDEIMIDYYGTPTPLNQLAGMSAPEPTLIVIQAYDKNAIPEIEKAILQSELGLNPNNDGTLIRIPIPELTEERRVELTKVVGRVAEQGKTAVRNIRRDANERIKKLQGDKEISEDDEHRAYKRVQELTDDYCSKIDELAERKSKEILEF